MADPSRFPSLTLPFAITGASAGWLTSGLTPHWVLHGEDPHLRPWLAALGGLFGGLLGFALRRLAVGRHYSWEVIAADPDTRPPTDKWLYHLLAVFCAAAATGLSASFLTGRFDTSHGALGGVLFVTPFLPVCAAVLWFGRRAQRARLGSVVAASDKRAVWGTLAATLSVVTLEALPQSPLLAQLHPLYGKAPSLALAAAIFITTGVVLALDLRALSDLKRAVTTCLVRHEEDVQRDGSSAPSHLDVGLGAGLLAHKEVSALVYRGRDRVLALIEGDPEEAVSALRSAIRRGVAGAALTAGVLALHLSTNGHELFLRYEQSRCGDGHPWCCQAGAAAAKQDSERTIWLLERGCDDGNGRSCLTLASHYRGDAALMTRFEFRAAQRGICPEGTQIVWRSREGLCVSPAEGFTK